MTIDEYWKKFLVETHRDESELCSGDLSFEAKGVFNDAEIALILAGKKTAIFSSFASFSIDNLPLPMSGELYIVLDRAENPHCVIELDSIEILPFNEVTWEMAKLEGEDENIDAWREKQKENLEDEGSILGFSFAEDIRLVFQTFHIVWK